jgi:hypothetical protein
MRVINVAVMCLEVLNLAIGYFPEPRVPTTVVYSLADDGLGTLRDAVATGGAIVFDVSGTIRLKSDLLITKTGTQILGQTSPGGITICGATVEVSADYAYLSHLRIRTGKSLKDNPPKSLDGIRVRDCTGVTLDCLSISWASDENIDCWTGVKRLTIRGCIVSECLHPHSCGGRFGPGTAENPVDLHISKTLFAHCNSRCPLLTHGVRASLSNVVIYNAGSQAIACGGAGEDPIHLAASGCVCIAGPNSPKRLQMFEVDHTAKVLSRDCWSVPFGKPQGSQVPVILWEQAAPSNYWTPEAPDVATIGHIKGNPRGIVAHVLKDCGARSWSRDAVDVRVIKEVKEGKGGRISNESERESLGIEWSEVTQPEEVKR